MSDHIKPGGIRISDKDHLIPGQIRTGDGNHTLYEGREQKEMVVINDGDRPIQTGSHIHFPDVNPALSFDREAAQGYHLAIPAGKSIRFEPGASRKVLLVELGGKKIVRGLQIYNQSNQNNNG